MKRSIGVSAAGCEIVAIRAGVPFAVAGANPIVRSGKNAACAGAAVTANSTTTSTAMRAILAMGMFASALGPNR